MKFKDDIVAARFDDMHPRTQELAIEMDNWSVENYGKEITLTATTSTKEEDAHLGRKSDTHRTGRAFDVRVHDLRAEHIADLCAYFRKKYPTLGAYSDNQHQLIVYKPHGTGPHLHVQLKRTYTQLIQEKNRGTTQIS
jgi:hypothetical protein